MEADGRNPARHPGPRAAPCAASSGGGGRGRSEWRRRWSCRSGPPVSVETEAVRGSPHCPCPAILLQAVQSASRPRRASAGPFRMAAVRATAKADQEPAPPGKAVRRSPRSAGGMRARAWLSLASDQPLQGLLDHVFSSHPILPLLRNPRLTPVRPGKLAANGPGRVGVVAQVDGPQHGVPEVLGVVEGPQGGFQILDDVARSLRYPVGALASWAAALQPRKLRARPTALR